MGAATPRICAAIAVTLVLGMCTVFAQQSPGRWVTDKYAKVPVGSEEYTNTVLDNKLYLIGGNAAVLTPGARSTHPARVLVYDLANNMFFFLVHLSPAASYSQTAPGGVPVMPTGFPPKRYSLPLATTPLRSSFISGTGARRTQRPSALA